MALTPQQRRRNRANALMFAAYVARNKWRPVEDATVHLDFVNDRYFWGGQERSRSEFANFTLSGGCFMASNGLYVNGVATNLAVDILTSSLGLSAPFAMIASGTQVNTSATYYLASIDGGTAANFMAVAVAGTRQTLVTTANVAQANITNSGIVGGTRQTVGGNFETNNILQSANGATGGAADTSASLPVVTTLRVGERPGNTSPFLGAIHHVVIYPGAHTQTLLNARTAIVHGLSTGP